MRAHGARRMNMGTIAMADEPASTTPASPGAGLEALLANRRAFLAYVERRVGDRATAEEIVQEAFVRSLNEGGQIRDSMVGWFYRVLHNAVVDHVRRRGVVNRRLEQFAAE